MNRRRHRPVILAALTLVLTLFPVVPASAAYSTAFAKGVLTVTGGTANDDMEVRCDGTGKVVVNNKRVSGGLKCAAVKRLMVSGMAGDDSIDADGISPAGFTSLNRVTLLGGLGEDFLGAAQIGTELEGGAGPDVLAGGAASDDFSGGPGKDVAMMQTSAGLTLDDNSSFGAETGSDAFSSVAWVTVSVVGSAPVTVDGSSRTRPLGVLGGSMNDTYYGGLGDDYFMPLGGADAVYGGGGTDTILSDTDTNQQLFNTSLADGSGMVDTLDSIESARLSSGDVGNTLDASAFNKGPVQLEGNGGNDTLLGGSGDDTLMGGPGSDTCNGDGGANTYKGCETKLE